VPASGLTRSEYLAKNLARHLNDEGAANFSNARARVEIMKAGGPDIGVAGAQEAKYKAIYADHQAGKIDQPTAEKSMGSLFGKGERTSTTGELYEDYYGKSYAQDWDKTQTRVPAGGRAP
jgi:type VI secretion system secreted protein VgrG